MRARVVVVLEGAYAKGDAVCDPAGGARGAGGAHALAIDGYHPRTAGARPPSTRLIVVITAEFGREPGRGAGEWRGAPGTATRVGVCP